MNANHPNWWKEEKEDCDGGEDRHCDSDDNIAFLSHKKFNLTRYYTPTKVGKQWKNKPIGALFRAFVSQIGQFVAREDVIFFAKLTMGSGGRSLIREAQKRVFSES